MKPHRMSLILGGVLLVLVAGAGAGYVYGIKYLTTRTTVLETQLTEAAQADADVASLATSKARYDKSIAPMEATIEKALPKTKEQTEILIQLERVAEANGLTLSAVSLPNPGGLPSATSQTSASSGILALPISFQLTGSYAQLQSFLTVIENLSRSTTVTGLSVTRADATKPITYAITLNVYVKP